MTNRRKEDNIKKPIKDLKIDKDKPKFKEVLSSIVGSKSNGSNDGNTK